MKKNFLALGIGAAKVGAFALALGLAACGDDSSSSGPSGDGNAAEESSSSVILSEGSAGVEGSSSSIVSSSSDVIPGTDPGSSSSVASSSSVTSSSSVESSSSVVSSSSEKNSSSVASSSSAKSSSSVASSSSAESSSSSVILSSSSEESSIKDGSEYDAVAGTLTDLRDGLVYKTVTIGTQTWMAENLNYDPGNVYSMGTYAWSGCYNRMADSCAKYGRLYTWEVAMNDASCAYRKTCNSTLNPATPVRGVCPQGWHLPSHDEFENLVNYIDPTFGYGHTTDASSSTAGKFLKSKSGWNTSGNGTDAYGFSALPAGRRNLMGNFNSAGIYANFWSSGEYSSDYAFSLYLYYNYESADLYYGNKYNAWSVRCLKD